MIVDVDRPVIRMFVQQLVTVRWETRLADRRGMELKVFGPGALRRSYSFQDALSLVEYQVQFERQLLSVVTGCYPLVNGDRDMTGAGNLALRRQAQEVTTEGPGMLHIVAKNDSPVQRIDVARRHIETAIAHINDVAQTRVLEQSASTSGVDELRLIVRALADIREALRSREWSPSTDQAPQAKPAMLLD